jgi:hypothetical protein
VDEHKITCGLITICLWYLFSFKKLRGLEVKATASKVRGVPGLIPTEKNSSESVGIPCDS